MKDRRPKPIFQQGPIDPQMIARSIANHASQTGIGAHSIFLGQVRADEVANQGRVKAIEYTAYESMATELAFTIREEIFAQFELTCMHIHHSLGRVNAGEICLFVFTSAKHRKAATAACSAIVERIKQELPIWGKEIMADQQHQWKQNH